MSGAGCITCLLEEGSRVFQLTFQNGPGSSAAALLQLKKEELRGVNWNVVRCFCNGHGVKFAAPPTTLLSWHSAALCCWACRVGLCVCLMFEAGRSLMIDVLLASYILLSCFASCLPFLSCLPSLTCVSGLAGFDVSLSRQRLQKGDSFEIQAIVDSTNTLMIPHTILFK